MITDPPKSAAAPRAKVPWLNRTVLGIGLASLCSDWSHEIATTVLPAFLATLGGAAVWLGLIEGVADGLSSLAKLASGYYTDKLARRKPIAVAGYLVTALGTASFGLASAPWHILTARAVAWFGRGVRTPVRKALLAGSVTREAYGRAFGFERMLDTLGAIVGPASAYVLLQFLAPHYSRIFAWTLIPSLTAAGLMAWLVKEQERKPVAHVSFDQQVRGLPARYRRFVLAVGLFGAGAFAPTFLILLAVQKLTPTLGATRAAGVAVALYVLHNVIAALFALLGGRLGDRFPKQRLLAAGYGLFALMSLAILLLPPTVGTLALIFILGGASVALAETLADSLCAELTPAAQHGMAFGVLATVNGAGDCVSSILVGALWTGLGTTAAFGYSAALALAGAWLVLRISSPSHTAHAINGSSN
jgi:MFS family permease